MRFENSSFNCRGYIFTFARRVITCPSKFFQGVLLDGLLVAVKKFQHPNVLTTGKINELHLISKLKHRNIVKLIGYSGEVHERAKWVEDGKVEAKEDKGTSYLLVEEYMLNGSLDKVINGVFKLNY